MGEVLADAAALLQHLRDRRRDVGRRRIELELVVDAASQIDRAFEHRAAGRERLGRVVRDIERRLGHAARRSGTARCRDRSASLLVKHLVELIPGDSTWRSRRRRPVDLDGAARMQHELLVRHLHVEDRDRIAETVEPIVAKRGRRIDDQAVVADRLLRRRHAATCARGAATARPMRIAVQRAVADIENHGCGSLRVCTRCGASSVRLK